MLLCCVLVSGKLVVLGNHVELIFCTAGPLTYPVLTRCLSVMIAMLVRTSTWMGTRNFCFLLSAASWMMGPLHVMLDAMLIHLSFLTFIYPSCTRYHLSNKATDVYVALLFISYTPHAPSCYIARLPSSVRISSSACCTTRMEDEGFSKHIKGIFIGHARMKRHTSYVTVAYHIRLSLQKSGHDERIA